MKFENGNEISFFKVLSRESETSIQVPTPFAKKYLEKGNNNNKIQTVVLKTQSHVEWNVDFLKINDGYYFTEGWFKFKKDNHLKTFDFLVFFLRSRSSKLTTFEVFSYATTGCAKNLSISHSRNVLTPDREVGCDNLSKTVGEKLERTIQNYSMQTMPLNKGFVKAVGIDGPCDLKLENDEGKIWEADLRFWGKLKKPYIVAGWADFVTENKLKIGNRCEFSHVKGNILHVHVIKKPKASRKHTDLESGKADDSASNFNSDNPYYMVRIRNSYIRSSGVSANAGFCRKYLTYDKKSATCVLHSDGRNWGQVMCMVYPTSARLYGKNWKKFSNANHLRVGDVCVFELINNIENVLKVTIFRAKLKK